MKLAAANDLQFLAGGGEMGELTRSKDWSNTAVGDPEIWPQSLRTTLGIILNSKFPMFLWWGPELICFYNDAYRPSLGINGKHPSILGMKAVDAWPEIWDIIQPLIDKTLQGEAVWFDDLLVPIYRNGKIEDVYWTFSYSPVKDESDEVAGVLVTCTETTDKVNTLKSLQDSEQRFRNTVKQAPVGITILRGKDFIVEMANEPYLQLVDRKEETFVGRPLFDSLPEVEEVVHPLLDGVLITGMPYRGNEVPIPVQRFGKKAVSYFDFLYYPLKEEDGSISGIIVTVTEVVEQVMARKKIEESEARFRSLIEQSPMAMVVLKGADHIVEIANSAMLKRWNKTMQEIANKKFIDVFPEIRDQKFPALLDRVYETGKVYMESEAVSQIQDKEGKRTLYVDFEYSPLFEADGSVSGVIATVIDVTEKVEARMKIEESEKKFRLLADSMPQHIWTSDTEGNLNYFNRSVFDYSGLTPQQIDKEGWIQIVHPDDREENIKQWSYAIATGKDFLLEHRFRRHDGTYRWQLSRAIPQKDDKGRIQMWVGTSTDIQDLKELDQQKDSFLSMASHELKTPVTTIKAYGQIAETMLAKKGDMETLAMISKMGIQVNKLTNLIGDLLDITRIQKGKLHYNEEFFDLNDVVKDVVDDMQRTSTTHRIQNNAGEDIKLYGDKEKIGQVLNNLISNAIKYSPGAHQIMVSTQPKDNGVELSVKDYGIGIPVKEHQHVFEQFYRVTGNNQSTFPGMGIGLYICSEITKMHGGKIWADSVMGEGSTFHVWLPKDHRVVNP